MEQGGWKIGERDVVYRKGVIFCPVPKRSGIGIFYGNLNDVFGMAAAAGSIGGREKTYLAAAVAMQYISTFLQGFGSRGKCFFVTHVYVKSLFVV